MTIDKLIEILSELHPEADFENSTTLIDDCILDSFDIVTIIADVEDAYGVVIPAEEILPENFNSAGALFSLIKRLQ